MNCRLQSLDVSVYSICLESLPYGHGYIFFKYYNPKLLTSAFFLGPSQAASIHRSILLWPDHFPFKAHSVLRCFSSVFVNDRAPAWICPICFPLSCIGTIQGFQTQPTCGPIKLLHMTATFGSNCWRTVKHFANPERLLHFHQPCFENRLKSPPQPPPPTISLKKKNFMKDFCLYSGPCKMVTAAGYGGHNYLSTQRKIQILPIRD